MRMTESEPTPLRSDASELVLSTDGDFTVETYMFEPAPAEQRLGRLFAAGETEDRDGIGKELLDMTVQALQKEYYRDTSRNPLNSFESALHQANLVLHDAAEQGIRDWMGYFHVAIGVLAKESLHVSTAGHGTILLARRSTVTELSTDLSYSPITEPLRTFSQVASGTVAPRDVVFFGTAALQTAFRREDLARIAIDHAADRISSRLEQLHEDQQLTIPLASIVVTAGSPAIAVAPAETAGNEEAPRRESVMATVTPRQPLIIERSLLRAGLAIIARLARTSLGWLQKVGWPLLLRGSRASGRVVAAASVSTGQAVGELTRSGVTRVQQRRDPSVSTSASDIPRRRSVVQSLLQSIVAVPQRIRSAIVGLPRTSKIFAVITIILALVLVATLSLLQRKRTEDANIQQASETLHDARTKADAAETALIYDNRDQARTLLSEADEQVAQIVATGLYVDEVQTLQAQIETVQDRLQRIARASSASTAVVGDFKEELGSSVPTFLAVLGETLYTFNPDTNAIISMTNDGTATLVTETTSGIGFLRGGITHSADKTIVYATDDPGIALFDSKSGELSDQEIEFSSENPNVGDVATYGSRLYLHDRAANSILSYSKSLRGYGAGSSWISDPDFPTDSIVSFGVDGSIYTLHNDGEIRKLFKGEQDEFTAEPVDPPLAGATKIVTSDELRLVYVFDPTRSRVVIFDKDGALQQQVVLDVAPDLRDVAVSPDEDIIYALDGTRVLAVPVTSD